ncbi:IPExxxVDY family protein [Hymenobacter sp. BRD67]|uniref:IPExxxVDY family protein n=1 Tax=Hymenobacter sp. BRD67 TaxID=2675877 RepID=UPI001565DF08|nr:IPExxxVDY family protein [Hymenobacter sp. BRD67]QKG53252.1 IPExxxVDY family protein [Hymenobacter sp. BRD67]
MKMLTLEAEYDCDFALFGLVSSTRDYTLAWSLNRQLRLRLVRQPDFILNLVQQGALAFSYYLYATEVLTLRLLRNRAAQPSTLQKPFLAPISGSMITCCRCRVGLMSGPAVSCSTG